MSLLSYLIPQTLLHTSSRYNEDIRVLEEWGKRRLLVNGSRQSGPTIQKLWEQSIDEFALPQLSKRPLILVLGVGGGTVIKLLAERYFEPRITAVDIDASIIAIARKYFDLDSIHHIRYVVNDAHKFIQTVDKVHYDVVVVDLFIGRTIPSFVSTSAFYQTLKRRLRPGGIVLINYLRELHYHQKSESLRKTLLTLFPVVRDFSISNNRFFYVQA